MGILQLGEISIMTFEKDELYYIKFWDHCLSEEHTLMESEVVGWVISQDKLRLTVSFWNVTRKDWKKHSHEPVNILKSAIIKKRKLII